MLNDINPSSNDFNSLLKYEEYILNLIIKTEIIINKKKKQIGKFKKQLRKKGNTKESSKIIKTSLSRLNDSIDGYKYLLFLWRCFGDGIAFKFLSKWNLKRFLYNTHNSEVKQQSGYIGGKSGLKNEWNFVKDAAKHNVPAILCDITNSIRHGDVLLLGANDPFVIEVKSSSNFKKRIEKQKESITTLHNYLNNDNGDISGFSGMKRVEMKIAEVNYFKEMNYVITAINNKPYAKISPELGLHYIAISKNNTESYEKIFKGIENPIAFIINDPKTDMSWGNFYPFTLSIDNPETLYSFLTNRFWLFVIIEIDVFKTMAKIKIDCDIDLITMKDGYTGLKMIKKLPHCEDPLIAYVSPLFFGRIAFEFISLEWFVKNEEVLIADIVKNSNGNYHDSIN